MPERKTKYRSELFYSKRHFKNFFSKWKGRLNDTFQFRIENAFETSNNNKSNQIQNKIFNRLSREGRLYDTSLF